MTTDSNGIAVSTTVLTLSGAVTQVTAGGSGWSDMEHPPSTPDWASAEIVTEIKGKAFRIGAGTSPGAFAAMTSVLLTAMQLKRDVTVGYYLRSDADTPILLAVQLRVG